MMEVEEKLVLRVVKDPREMQAIGAVWDMMVVEAKLDTRGHRAMWVTLVVKDVQALTDPLVMMVVGEILDTQVAKEILDTQVPQDMWAAQVLKLDTQVAEDMTEVKVLDLLDQLDMQAASEILDMLVVRGRQVLLAVEEMLDMWDL
jgi:hypothetical protein